MAVILNRSLPNLYLLKYNVSQVRPSGHPQNPPRHQSASLLNMYSLYIIRAQKRNIPKRTSVRTVLHYLSITRAKMACNDSKTRENKAIYNTYDQL